MNVYLIVSSVITAVVIAVWWFLYRLYKQVGRRCRKKGCGCTRVRRVFKIILAEGEEVSIHSSGGKLRWWIRRLVKLTFSSCPNCGWTELVKIDMDPMSLLHAYLEWIFHRQRFKLDEFRLIEVTARKLRSLYHSDAGRRRTKLDASAESQTTDTPPISLFTLFEDYLRDISGVIDGD